MTTKIVTPPTAELLTLDECREQLGVEPYAFDSDGVGTHPHDAMIMRMQAQARAYCEYFTGLSLVQKVYEIALDAFPPSEIELPMPPVVQIEQITYVDADQAEQTVDPANYVLDDYQKPAWLLPAVDVPWPTAGSFINAVKIQYRSGYLGSEPTSDAVGEPLPGGLQSGIVVHMAYLYAHREAAPTAAEQEGHERAMESILRPYRILLGMA